MTDRKLTEAEMISYLELSVELGSTAKLAPEEAKILLDLINRQKAENESLQHKYELAVAEREANVKGFTETLEKQRAEIEKLTAERDEARRDSAVAEKNHQMSVAGYKTALLKRIFPYDAADKKQYSINAYAVERAIVEVAEQMTGG